MRRIPWKPESIRHFTNRLTLNINVGIGLTSPQEQVNCFICGLQTLRDILADGVLERYGLRMAEVIKDIFGNLGCKSGGLFFDESQDPVVTGLRATVQQLEQRLTLKQDPELPKAQIRKVMAAAGYRVPVPPGVDPNFGAGAGAPLTEGVPATPLPPHTHPDRAQPPTDADRGAAAGIETPAIDAVPA